MLLNISLENYYLVTNTEEKRNNLDMQVLVQKRMERREKSYLKIRYTFE